MHLAVSDHLRAPVLHQEFQKEKNSNIQSFSTQYVAVFPLYANNDYAGNKTRLVHGNVQIDGKYSFSRFSKTFSNGKTLSLSHQIRLARTVILSMK